MNSKPAQKEFKDWRPDGNLKKKNKRSSAHYHCKARPMRGGSIPLKNEPLAFHCVPPPCSLDNSHSTWLPSSAVARSSRHSWPFFLQDQKLREYDDKLLKFSVVFTSFSNFLWVFTRQVHQCYKWDSTGQETTNYPNVEV